MLGSMHDHAIFNDSGSYRDLALFYSPGQNVTGDKGFTGKETHVIFQSKSWKETIWRQKRKRIKYIRKKCMVNEWSIGLFKHLYPLFIGH